MADKDWYKDGNGMWVNVVVVDKILYIDGMQQDQSRTRDEIFRERNLVTPMEAWHRGVL